MALQLNQIPGNLQSMSRELSGDADIKNDVNKLVIRGSKCVQSFDRMMRYEYREVFIQKELLFQANDAGEVNVPKLTKSVSDMTAALKAIRDDVMSTQSEVHSDIEKCRARVREKQNNLQQFEYTVSRMEREIREFESNILRLDGEINELDDNAGKLESRAREIDREAEEKTGWGIGGIVMAVAGVILAPVTFGLSLSLTATGGILAGVNLSNAADCRDGAQRARNSAWEKRNESSGLSSRKIEMQNEIRENKLNIRSTKTEIETIESDERTLQRMIGQMYEFVTVIDNVLNVFQEAETTLKDVHVNSASFSVMKNAFMRNPTKAADMSQRHLAHLKAKWEEMETILSRHGINPRIAY
ncbi:uncharacterized protein LOC127873079 [Dreissena polymorpha]|uniref:Uncharacterized protein n=1 Tax=Dreissena polymorpha TaxID=45954 RepID=A0A9D4KTR0_DREPO|nr:uncharacterized protein LOC127873078 [Dreissena polymorpha]XP_052272639.1 uncharacterized protein LOC127873078 [Dreissena polymorpha]XP_052272640.1 uncharacterized protein LOC127873079 [Dreissena polymorpha]XP_052272641.1 uncharacterized protein LOC127873079 [Dreissena polymorpha]KAH3845406.1 hypothetical protein DPMN_087686 [Dreissena polymorpha]KAH3845464.1 hypothetical protein DPMN_087745 [Dreissena polymorpha]